MPKYQVNRFHTIAPTSAAVIATSGTVPPTIPLPTVLATSVPLIAPMKLSAAAIVIATHGDSTRVEMTVATALAVSWNPLMKSNTTASEISRISSGVTPVSGMLDHQPAQDV